MDNIKVFKLVDGTLVCGKETEEEIIDVIEVVIQASPNGVNIAFAPFMFPFNQELTGMNVNLRNVISSLPADERMVTQYVQATTGIVVTNQMPPKEAAPTKGSSLRLVKP